VSPSTRHGSLQAGLSVHFAPLLDYSDHERQKWREWIAADPTRVAIPVQPGGRFPTGAELLDHIFYVERRHLSRLQGATPPEESGVPLGDWQRLFEYADLVRADLRRYVSDVTDAVADSQIGWNAIGIGPISLSRRRLLMHVFLHEVRHLAQLAQAARAAGIEPPGNHDLFLFEEFD
jgi:uncharacterized damage-inducible protein DinB